MISIAVIILVIAVGLGILDFTGHRVVALMLLLAVSGLSLFMEIRPVVVAATLSAIAWDYLFIPPRFTFSVGDTEDRLLLATYVGVVLIHAVMTQRIKAVEREVRRKEVKANAVRYYNTLLNSLSHELRTPITTIVGAADTLQSNEDISAADRSELVNEIATASLRLNQQVENLLNMSRIESGVFELRRDWVDVKELIYATLTRMEPHISKWQAHVAVPDHLPLFKLDYGLIQQVIHNLVSNVMQHTPEGSAFTVSASCIDDKLVLKVSDNGKGFPEADIEKVFDKFYRVKGSRAGGTGLGLSIVKGFVEAHDGTVKLKNLPLMGAEICIEIPAEMSYLNGLKNE